MQDEARHALAAARHAMKVLLAASVTVGAARAGRCCGRAWDGRGRISRRTSSGGCRNQRQWRPLPNRLFPGLSTLPALPSHERVDPCTPERDPAPHQRQGPPIHQSNREALPSKVRNHVVDRHEVRAIGLYQAPIHILEFRRPSPAGHGLSPSVLTDTLSSRWNDIVQGYVGQRGRAISGTFLLGKAHGNDQDCLGTVFGDLRNGPWDV